MYIRKNHIRGLWLGLAASLLLHMALLLFLTDAMLPKQKSAPKVFEVSFAPPFPRKTSQSQSAKPQIVTEPKNAPVVTENQPARYLAEKNRVAPKEQIKRGDGPDAGPSVGKSSGTPPVRQGSQRTPPKENTSNPKRISSLKLSNSELAREFGEVAEPKTSKPARELLESPSPLNGYQAFSRPTGSGARFLGQAGSSDFLPNLPDGDITLLNTKASRYAVFVRRVATRVFSKLRASGWESLAQSDIRSIQQFSTVEAVLSPDGKLLSARISGPSGSRNFDAVLLSATNGGAADPHPPPGARAADGNIHFIFKARSWSRVGPSRGGRGIAEQRWLLLSTGLG